MRPFAAVGSVFSTTGATVALGSRMLFARARGWGVYLSRTRIDYRNEIGDPSTNSIIGAVVGWIARNFPEAPVRIVLESDPERKPIVRSLNGPGAMLRLLERPNPYYSGVLQWNATIVDYMLGNAYWIKQRASASNRRVIALWWVPDALMEPKWPDNDPSVFISHYEYMVDGVPIIVPVDDVVHFRNGIDPANPRKGLSRLGSLFREIFTDDESANFTASLLRNLGVPGVILAPSNTAPGGKVDADTIKSKYNEAFGGDNRGAVMVMTGPTEAKVLSWSPEQMNLKELRRIPEERVSAVLGVPAGVAGLGAGLDRNTFSNYGEANKAAINQGVVPLHRLIAAELEVQLLPEFADTESTPYDVFFDITVIAAMQEALDAIWKRNQEAATKGLVTRADFKRAVGLKVAADGSDDVYILPNNFVTVPLDEAGEPTPRLTVVPAPGPGAPDGGEADEPAAAAEIRCANADCGKLLAEEATAPYRFTCPRCKTVNAAA
ncbi:MAG TPA: phage portal protein [Actinomycetota bacterium]